MNIGFDVDRENELRVRAGIAVNSLEIAAESVANKHFSDPFIRDNFRRDVSDFITANMRFFDSTSNDRDRREVIYNLSEEKNSLLRQSNDLTLGNAKVYVSAKIEEINNKYGYLVDGICILLGTSQMIAGGIIVTGSLSIANPIGVVIGAHVVLSGASSTIESFRHLLGNETAVGFMKKAYMSSAEFLGFTRKEGLIAYYAIDGMTSLYGAARLIVNPSARRLFHYMPAEYVRRFTTLGKTELTLEFGKALYKGANTYNIKESETGQFDY
ncbi:DUF4225 domain-containing protein [Morganella morganii]|uniref:DUF4225 domain-containing protein n=1 Tax=Morganella morganii TaxID=582 RepID=UPI00116524AA|nr:DUF4225 domain-containing protein [Morganella morganii]QQO73598.1 DUF4225 domain-containing protein [Morganella morganii]